MLAPLDNLPMEVGLPTYLWSTLDDYQFSWDNNASLSFCLPLLPVTFFVIICFLSPPLICSTGPLTVCTHSEQNTYSGLF